MDRMSLQQSCLKERRSKRQYFSSKRAIYHIATASDQLYLPYLSQYILDWAADGPFLHLSSQTQCKGWQLVNGDILSTGPLKPLACCPCEVWAGQMYAEKRFRQQWIGDRAVGFFFFSFFLRKTFHPQQDIVCISYKVLWTVSFFNKFLLQKKPHWLHRQRTCWWRKCGSTRADPSARVDRSVVTQFSHSRIRTFQFG